MSARISSFLNLFHNIILYHKTCPAVNTGLSFAAKQKEKPAETKAKKMHIETKEEKDVSKFLDKKIEEAEGEFEEGLK